MIKHKGLDTDDYITYICNQAVFATPAKVAKSDRAITCKNCKRILRSQKKE